MSSQAEIVAPLTASDQCREDLARILQTWKPLMEGVNGDRLLDVMILSWCAGRDSALRAGAPLDFDPPLPPQ